MMPVVGRVGAAARRVGRAGHAWASSPVAAQQRHRSHTPPSQLEAVAVAVAATAAAQPILWQVVWAPSPAGDVHTSALNSHRMCQSGSVLCPHCFQRSASRHHNLKSSSRWQSRHFHPPLAAVICTVQSSMMHTGLVSVMQLHTYAEKYRWYQATCCNQTSTRAVKIDCLKYSICVTIAWAYKPLELCQ